MNARRTVPSFGLLAAMVLSLVTGPAARVGAATELLPDLRTVKPSAFYIENTQHGDKRLHLTNEIVNNQTGPLELTPRREDCNGDGDFDNDRTAYQIIYADTNGNGRFDRGTDVKSREVRAGCMRFHPAHNHWHFQNYARYRLVALDGTHIASGNKTSFCIIDTDHRNPNVPGSPQSGYYHVCTATSTTGMSAGWGDVYTANLQGQWIVINGVPDGDYCVESTADPSNLVVETNDTNNVGKQAINLSGNTVVPIDAACP